MNLLLAPLRPLADVLDLTAEALAAVGTVSVAALGLALTRESEGVTVLEHRPRPVATGTSSH